MIVQCARRSPWYGQRVDPPATGRFRSRRGRSPTTDDRRSHVDPLGPAVERARGGRGDALLETVDGEGGQCVTTLSPTALRLWRTTSTHAGSARSIVGRGMTAPQRQLLTLGVVTALGGSEPQLEVHVNASIKVGLSPVGIVEAASPATVYRGFPKALNAVLIANCAFAEHGLLPVRPATA